MTARTRKILLIAGAVVLASAVAHAQPTDLIADLLQQTTPDEAPVAAAAIVHAGAGTLSASDVSLLRQAIDSARRGDVNGARASMGQIVDPLARKVATWTLVDYDGPSLTFAEVDAARRSLRDWPHEERRNQAAEKLIAASGLSPAQIVAWFADRDPDTAQGAMALAAAERMQGHTEKAARLVKRWWRDRSFDADTQRNMLSRFGDLLTTEDHVRRVDILLYNQDTTAARDLLPLLPPEWQRAAEARLALKANAANAKDLADSLPASVANAPGVVFERAAYLRRRNLDSLALALVKGFPRDVATPEQAKAVWDERRQLMLVALKAGDARAAYAAADSGLTFGAEAADAEFFAGWIALTKLHDPAAAAVHFATIDRIGVTPITRARALYWEGRAAEAMQNKTRANGFYVAAAVHNTTFYGQLAAEKLGQRLTLVADPVLTAQDRAYFNALEPVQATRLLYDLGYRDLYRRFVLSLDDTLSSRQDEAQLVDLVRGYGDQSLSMRVARAAAQHGFVLPGRAYPYREPPQVDGAPEEALVLGVTRQESGFDPEVRSGVGARGMMQLMPATASIVAKRMGVSYSPSMLDQPEYNMKLGSSFLGRLVDQFSGSYVMAVAAYNAGPGRPTQWATYCGDPRTGSVDPIDFIECIPFSETRNYVQRVLEGMVVYRAKLNGGSAPITLAADLKRGGYSYPGAQPTPTLAANTSAPPASPETAGN